jgi:hypothetical protein
MTETVNIAIIQHTGDMATLNEQIVRDAVQGWKMKAAIAIESSSRLPSHHVAVLNCPSQEALIPANKTATTVDLDQALKRDPFLKAELRRVTHMPAQEGISITGDQVVNQCLSNYSAAKTNMKGKGMI